MRKKFSPISRNLWEYPFSMNNSRSKKQNTPSWLINFSTKNVSLISSKTRSKTMKRIYCPSQASIRSYKKRWINLMRKRRKQKKLMKKLDAKFRKWLAKTKCWKLNYRKKEENGKPKEKNISTYSTYYIGNQDL